MDDTAPQTVVAIGNFDGVHRGHAALLRAGRRIADELGLAFVALTFEPHPREFFKPGGAPFRITPEHVKERQLLAAGSGRVDVLDFNSIMSGLTAEQFVDMILVDHLNAAHVVVGADFHFGKNRGGNVAMLEADGRFKVDGVALESIHALPVSSTRIRECIAAGDIAGANELLGWAWEIEGEVEHGDKRGRTLGYPTANLPLRDTIIPAYGIYAVRALVGGMWRNAVANIGIRPMFEAKMPLLEVYIFDFDGDLYGQTLRIQPVQKLRDEQVFANLDALKARMAQDCDQARTVLARF